MTPWKGYTKCASHHVNQLTRGLLPHPCMHPKSTDVHTHAHPFRTSPWLFWQAMRSGVNDRSFLASTAAPASRSSRTASKCPPFAASRRGVNALSLRASIFAPPSRSWPNGGGVGGIRIGVGRGGRRRGGADAYFSALSYMFWPASEGSRVERRRGGSMLTAEG